MAPKYDHSEIEKKWQKKWEVDGLYNTEEDSKKPKQYVLDMFPYPSGEGLHVGHPKGYIATDIYSRFKRMNGFNVLHPMGWDAFGLPAENFAIKNKVHPRVAVEKNIKRFKEQLSVIGFNYDWSREINTTDPEYYKWTQWIFLKLFEKGLAYESNEPINWCPSCQTGLANEDLNSDGTCERCDTEVEKRPMRQWVLKITDYADRLLEDLETLAEWPESIKEAQRNWIGRSRGAEIEFAIKDSELKVKVFTTRPDTLFGATYMVLAPEHSLVEKLKDKIGNWDEVYQYVKKTVNKSEVERTTERKERGGVRLEGVVAVNPGNQEEVPVYIADHVLAHYGTGAIMAVPAHDERDFKFAQQFDLPKRTVVVPHETSVPRARSVAHHRSVADPKDLFVEPGRLVDSGDFAGLDSEEAKEKITKFVGGKFTSTYRIQDWVFSRQRYWGEPIPIIHCAKCGTVPVPEKDLPVLLPEVEQYEPTGTGESPLANIKKWVHVQCPKCAGDAKRETNTMPQWAGSSWYWLRFMDPQNSENFVSKEKEKYWGPVDVYVGGDHAVRHLIYARFWHKFLYDLRAVSTIEPFTRLEFLGFILAEDGRKMSKRWGNVINPDEVVERNGADSFRTYEMFMGPFENTVPWSMNGLVGVRRFLERVWRMIDYVEDNDVPELEHELHKAIEKTTKDIEAFKFNTAVSQMMIFCNVVEEQKKIGKTQFEMFLRVLAPFAPHLSEEIWESLGHRNSVHLEEWPRFSEEALREEKTTIAVQINGKIRGQFEVKTGTNEEDVVQQAKQVKSVEKYLKDTPIKRHIYVQNRLINFVTK